MATSTYGTPYVQSTDTVSGYPTVSENLATRVDDVSVKGNGINAQTGTTYTLVLTDAGKTVTLSNASAVALTVPTNASVAHPVGTGIALINLGAGTVTVAGASGATVSGSSLTLSQFEGMVLRKTATNTWVAVKGGGGLPKASASGGNTTNTYTSGGINYKSHIFSSNGTLTVSVAGIVDFMIVSGGNGGGGEYASAGTGGSVCWGKAYLAAGTYSTIIGAGSTTVGTTATGNPGGVGGFSAFGTLNSAVVASYNTAGQNAPITNAFATGSNITYASSSAGSVTANSGNGGTKAACCSGPPGVAGSSGVVVIRYEV